MDKLQVSELATEINELGEKLAETYQKLRGIQGLTFYALYYPRVNDKNNQIEMVNMTNNWAVEARLEVCARDAISARRREEQVQIMQRQKVEAIQQGERDNIQNQINLIDYETSNLTAVIERHKGWQGGNIQLEIASIQRQIDAKKLEIDELKLQLDTRYNG